MPTWREQFNSIVEQAAGEARTILQREPWTPVCIAVQPALDGHWGDLRAIQQTDTLPDGYDLLTPERFPVNRPLTYLPEWIRSFSPAIIGS